MKTETKQGPGPLIDEQQCIRCARPLDRDHYRGFVYGVGLDILCGLCWEVTASGFEDGTVVRDVE